MCGGQKERGNKRERLSQGEREGREGGRDGGGREGGREGGRDGEGREGGRRDGRGRGGRETEGGRDGGHYRGVANEEAEDKGLGKGHTTHSGCLKSTVTMTSTPLSFSPSLTTPCDCIVSRNLESLRYEDFLMSSFKSDGLGREGGREGRREGGNEREGERGREEREGMREREGGRGREGGRERE